mmetsp:Transcript_1985/g.2796  ORF Transcript_1985/g.2796 Transcript_1985/m.2796 type:complete len:493 (+) Transcript_1985:206-1684(+)
MLPKLHKHHTESLEVFSSVNDDKFEQDWFPALTSEEREAYTKDWETLAASLFPGGVSLANKPIKRNDIFRYLEGVRNITLGLLDELLVLVINRVPPAFDLESVKQNVSERAGTKTFEPPTRVIKSSRSASVPDNPIFRPTAYASYADSEAFLLHTPNIHVKMHEFLGACYLLSRFIQGYPLPPMFPLECFAGFHQLLGLECSPCVDGLLLGSKMRPISYRDFAFMFRPLLDRAFRARQNLWRKRSMIVAAWVPEENEMGGLKTPTIISGNTETFSKASERFRACNIETTSMESWSIKKENFVSSYDFLVSPSTGEEVFIPDHLVGQPGRCIKDHLLRSLPEDELPTIDWDQLSKVLNEQRTLIGFNGPWKLARSKAIVVALELSPELVHQVLSEHEVFYDLSQLEEEMCLYREETYHPKYAFKPNDFLLGDVIESESITKLENGKGAPAMILASAHKYQWKKTNKLKSGQSLVTRTVERNSFLSTFKKLEVG